jgi:hypothetical protein
VPEVEGAIKKNKFDSNMLEIKKKELHVQVARSSQRVARSTTPVK